MKSARRVDRGTVVFSIDLETPGDWLASERRGGDRVTDALLDCLAARELPATWALPMPSESAAPRQILQANPVHEIAVLGTAAWIGRQAGRARFARQLSRRVLSARAAGLNVGTLVPRDVSVGEHLDLVLKHHISAVRGRVEVSGQRRIVQPSMLRYGLWSLPAALHLPGTSRLQAGGGQVHRVCRLIDGAARSGSALHIVIDAPRLAQRGRPAVHAIDRVFRHVARRQAEGLLRSATMAGLVARLSHQPRVTPTRSILRAA